MWNAGCSVQQNVMTIPESGTSMKGGDGPQGLWSGLAAAILSEASGVVAVAKPAGVPTQAPPGIPSMESWLRQRLTAGDSRGSAYVGIPHRLDRAVSGLLLLATTPRAARKLSRQFERREIGKRYLALLALDGSSAGLAARVALESSPAGVEWRDLLEKIPNEPRARIVPETDGGGREAVTRAGLLGILTTGELLVALEPSTGRMHQLRLQAASRGLPIVGDELYAPATTAGSNLTSTGPFGPAVVDPRQRAIALHASRLTYADPETLLLTTVEAPPPSFWPAEALAVITSATADTRS